MSVFTGAPAEAMWAGYRAFRTAHIPIGSTFGIEAMGIVYDDVAEGEDISTAR